MMTPEFKEQIKKVVGHRFAKPINKRLVEMGSREYSSSYISRVLCGDECNNDIETASLDVYTSKLEEIKAKEKRLQKIIKKAKA